MSGVLTLENNGLLFVDYSKEISETLADQTVLFGEVKQEQWEGDYKQFPVEVERIVSMGFAEDGSAFRAPDSNQVINGKIGRRFYNMKLEMTDGIMNAARGGQNSVSDATVIYMERAMKDLSKYLNLHMFRDGSGVVATIKDDAPTSSASNVAVDDNRLLWRKATYDVYDTTLTTLRGTAVVSLAQRDINSDGWAQVNFTTTLPAGTVQGDKLVWSGNLNRAIYGLDILIEDGAVHEIDPATYPTWASYVLDNGGVMRDMTPTLFRQLGAGIVQQAGSSNQSLNGLTYYADAWMGVEFEEMFQGAVRLEAGSTVSGAPAVTLTTSFGNVKIVTEIDSKRNTVFAVDMNQLTHFYQKLPAFRPVASNVFSPSQNYGAHVATLLGISQMAIKNRNSSGRINDIRSQATTAL